MRQQIIIFFFFHSMLLGCGEAGVEESRGERQNSAGQLEWFGKQGFGMFVHFGLDSQLGMVISHSLVGASDDYLDRYMSELPKTFNPEEFDAVRIARLAKVAGMKYIVFTAKHHSGFCMWDTETTGFNIMDTPYGRDLLGEYVKAVRSEGLGVGIYFSPEDFKFLHDNGVEVRRKFKDPIPGDIMQKYLSLNERQCTELMKNYGAIDILFFDSYEGPLLEKCKEVAWKLQPDVVITRGAIKTPEQTLLGAVSDEPWESCITMGTQWQFKPTNENYKSGGRLIELLTQTRAKGGNLLLNIGPGPTGAIHETQRNNLMEIGAWTFINQEAIIGTRPWIVPNEENIWFTWKPEEKTLYVVLTKIPDWTRGRRKEFTLKSVLVSPDTEVSVLGQSGKVVEYNPNADASTYFKQKEDGVHISCVRAQRIYNDHKWPNPVVLKMTHISPAFIPPVVVTQEAILNGDQAGSLQFKGELLDMGGAKTLKIGFQHREYAGFVEELYSDTWKETQGITTDRKGCFKQMAGFEKKGKEYQVRAFVDHPKIRIYGNIIRVRY